MSGLRAALCPNPQSELHKRWLGILAEGLGRHGVKCHWSAPGEPLEADFAACWGWRQGEQLQRRGARVLLLEHGYLGDRTGDQISLGWDGLNGRADFLNSHVPDDRAARWCRLLKPCRAFGDGPVIIMAQVLGDRSWGHTNGLGWYRRAYRMIEAELGESGRPILLRPHPLGMQQVPEYEMAEGSLEDTLADAAGVVTFSSNAGVDAMLAGVPSIAMDTGSMVWGVVPAKPPFERIDADRRSRWLTRIAYCQWSAAEVADGAAWAHIGQGFQSKG